jgi:hypothetical protein
LLLDLSREFLLVMASVSAFSIRERAAVDPPRSSACGRSLGHGVCWIENSHGVFSPSFLCAPEFFLLPILGFADGPMAHQVLRWRGRRIRSRSGRYRLYVGRASHSYHQFVETSGTTATISNLIEGITYFFAATAYDTAGVESGFSAEVSYTVPGEVTAFSGQRFQPRVCSSGDLAMIGGIHHYRGTLPRRWLCAPSGHRWPMRE